MHQNPKFIRVKRRRDDESVQGLLIDDPAAGKIKRGRFVYKKTKTVELNSYEEQTEDQTPLLKLSDEADQKHFVLETFNRKRRASGIDTQPQLNSPNPTTTTQHPDQLPDEINQMLTEYLKVSATTETPTKRKKPSRKHYLGENAKIATLPNLDYVYDIYHLENTLDDLQNEQLTKYGHLKIINIDHELVYDEISEPDTHFLSADDDSNEENYYKNDYPQDEDDDRSVLFGTDPEDSDDQPQQQQQIPQFNTAQDFINAKQNEYSHIFEALGNSTDILKTLNTTNFIDLDTPDNDEDYYNDELDNEEYYYDEDDY